MKNKTYTTKTVYYEDGTKFVVLNNKTKTIQSVWSKYIDAVNTARDLNKFMSKKTQLTNDKPCEIIDIQGRKNNGKI